MTQRTKGVLQSNITTQIAPNNSGQISAEDVRDNLLDITDSLVFLSSGNNALTGSFTGSFTGIFSGTHQGDGQGLTGIISSSYASTTLNASTASMGTDFLADSSLTVQGPTQLGTALTHTTIISGSVSIINTTDLADSTITIKDATYSQTSGSIDIHSQGDTQIPSIILRTLDESATFTIAEDGAGAAAIRQTGGGLALRADGDLELYGTRIIVTEGLPTTEPLQSGQLWLSGSAGNSKFLMVRD